VRPISVDFTSVGSQRMALAIRVKVSSSFTSNVRGASRVPDGIVTGRMDLWEPADLPEKLDRDMWDYETNENLQDRWIGQLLGAYDPKTRSWVNSTAVWLSKRLRLTTSVERYSRSLAAIGSRSSRQEARERPGGCFEPSFSGHFVVAGGRVEELPDEAG
jgi:hypothetical protein